MLKGEMKKGGGVKGGMGGDSIEFRVDDKVK